MSVDSRAARPDRDTVAQDQLPNAVWPLMHTLLSALHSPAAAHEARQAVTHTRKQSLALTTSRCYHPSAVKTRAVRGSIGTHTTITTPTSAPHTHTPLLPLSQSLSCHSPIATFHVNPPRVSCHCTAYCHDFTTRPHLLDLHLPRPATRTCCRCRRRTSATVTLAICY